MRYFIEFLHFVGGFTLIVALSLLAVSLAAPGGISFN